MTLVQQDKGLSVSTSSSRPLTRGRRLGKYHLQKRLGKGGYCEVWRARDTVEGITVALKIPQTDINGRRDNQSVLREVRLVARLRHPHLMPLKNADIIDGHAVLATEVSVGTLDDRSRPMAPRRILAIIAQVLDGLAHAHKNRMVHCDVTPGNIFLFPDGRTVLGDFGISLQVQGRMATIDEYGTPGYVAPEQAYGRPTYRSDCFAVGIILYEYLTGYLPRWPFKWPPRGHQRLAKLVNPALVALLRRALAIDPEKRFAHARQMLDALLLAVPNVLGKQGTAAAGPGKKPKWRQIRREAFVHRYGRVFPVRFRCVDCGEPVAEPMTICPWCGSQANRFDSRSQFSHICSRCHKGILPEWRYCPWCYGPAFKEPAQKKTAGIRYHDHCKYCAGKLMRFMRYCPWCRRKVRTPWEVRPFPEVCTACGCSLDSSFWNFCPWCTQRLIM